jgi:hypothetical protein
MINANNLNSLIFGDDGSVSFPTPPRPTSPDPISILYDIGETVCIGNTSPRRVWTENPEQLLIGLKVRDDRGFSFIRCFAILATAEDALMLSMILHPTVRYASRGRELFVISLTERLPYQRGLQVFRHLQFKVGEYGEVLHPSKSIQYPRRQVEVNKRLSLADLGLSS